MHVSHTKSSFPPLGVGEKYHIQFPFAYAWLGIKEGASTKQNSRHCSRNGWVHHFSVILDAWMRESPCPKSFFFSFFFLLVWERTINWNYPHTKTSNGTIWGEGLLRLPPPSSNEERQMSVSQRLLQPKRLFSLLWVTCCDDCIGLTIKIPLSTFS